MNVTIAKWIHDVHVTPKRAHKKALHFVEEYHTQFFGARFSHKAFNISLALSLIYPTLLALWHISSPDEDRFFGMQLFDIPNMWNTSFLLPAAILYLVLAWFLPKLFMDWYHMEIERFSNYLTQLCFNLLVFTLSAVLIGFTFAVYAADSVNISEMSLFYHLLYLAMALVLVSYGFLFDFIFLTVSLLLSLCLVLLKLIQIWLPDFGGIPPFLIVVAFISTFAVLRIQQAMGVYEQTQTYAVIAHRFQLFIVIILATTVGILLVYPIGNILKMDLQQFQIWVSSMPASAVGILLFSCVIPMLCAIANFLSLAYSRFTLERIQQNDHKYLWWVQTLGLHCLDILIKLFLAVLFTLALSLIFHSIYAIDANEFLIAAFRDPFGSGIILSFCLVVIFAPILLYAIIGIVILLIKLPLPFGSWLSMLLKAPVTSDKEGHYFWLLIMCCIYPVLAGFILYYGITGVLNLPMSGTLPPVAQLVCDSLTQAFSYENHCPIQSAKEIP